MRERKKIAAIITEYRVPAHADVIVGKFIKGFPTDDGLMARSLALFDRIADGLRAVDGVTEVRGRGCLIGVQLDREARPVVGALREAGVIVGTSGQPQTLRLMPPLTTTDADVDEFLRRFAAVLAA